MSVFANQETFIETLQKMGLSSEARNYKMLIGSPLPAKESRFPTFFPQNNEAAKMLMSLSVNATIEKIKNTFPTRDDVDFLRNEFSKMTSSNSAFPSLSRASASRSMRYTQYQQLRCLWRENLQPILSTKLFLQIGGNSLHTINADELFRYLDIVASAAYHFSTLMSFDPLQTGFLDENHFIQYVTQAGHEIGYLSEAGDDEDLFITYAAQRLMVVVDPLHTGRIPVRRLFDELIFISFTQYGINDDRGSPFGEGLVRRVIEEFQHLDHDGDGLLEPSDLAEMPNTIFTSAFIDRVFETLSCKPDFVWYARFRFAWDNLGARWANEFFFDIMDINNDGEITQFEMNFFYRELERMLLDHWPDHSLTPFDAIINEKLDMEGATDGHINRSLFINQRATETLIRLLVDFKAYMKWEYDQDITPQMLNETNSD